MVLQAVLKTEGAVPATRDERSRTAIEQVVITACEAVCVREERISCRVPA